MNDTEPLDLDALISGSNDLVVEAREYIDVLTIANRKPGPSSVDIMSRQADAIEALVAEVRRLRARLDEGPCWCPDCIAEDDA